MSDIVERLREWSLCNMYPESACTDIGVAINEITALRAENEKLRAALEMFACDCVENDLCKFPHACRNYVARAALGGKDE